MYVCCYLSEHPQCIVPEGCVSSSRHASLSPGLCAISADTDTDSSRHALFTSTHTRRSESPRGLPKYVQKIHLGVVCNGSRQHETSASHTGSTGEALSPLLGSARWNIVQMSRLDNGVVYNHTKLLHHLVCLLIFRGAKSVYVTK